VQSVSCPDQTSYPPLVRGSLANQPRRKAATIHTFGQGRYSNMSIE
jgi:hypothetical protein